MNQNLRPVGSFCRNGHCQIHVAAGLKIAFNEEINASRRDVTRSAAARLEAPLGGESRATGRVKLYRRALRNSTFVICLRVRKDLEIVK